MVDSGSETSVADMVRRAAEMAPLVKSHGEGNASPPHPPETPAPPPESQPTAPSSGAAPPAVSSIPSEITYEWKGQSFVEKDPEIIRAALQQRHDYSAKMAELRRAKEDPEFQQFRELRATLQANPRLARAMREVLQRSDDQEFLDRLTEGGADRGESSDLHPEDPAGRRITALQGDLQRLRQQMKEREDREAAAETNRVIEAELGKHAVFAHPGWKKAARASVVNGLALGNIDASGIAEAVSSLAAEFKTPASVPPAPPNRTIHTPEPPRGAGVPAQPREEVVLGKNTREAARAYVEQMRANIAP